MNINRNAVFVHACGVQTVRQQAAPVLHEALLRLRDRRLRAVEPHGLRLTKGVLAMRKEPEFRDADRHVLASLGGKHADRVELPVLFLNVNLVLVAAPPIAVDGQAVSHFLADWIRLCQFAPPQNEILAKLGGALERPAFGMVCVDLVVDPVLLLGKALLYTVWRITPSGFSNFFSIFIFASGLLTRYI